MKMLSVWLLITIITVAALTNKTLHQDTVILDAHYELAGFKIAYINAILDGDLEEIAFWTARFEALDAYLTKYREVEKMRAKAVIDFARAERKEAKNP